MESSFAYIVTAVSFISAVVAHKLIGANTTKVMVPSLVSAVITSFTAFMFYAFIGRSAEAISYLGLVFYALVIGFVLALIVGYFIKILPRLF